MKERIAVMSLYDTYIKNPLVDENVFILMPVEKSEIPSFKKVKDTLPQPFWRNHGTVIDCYWKAWELAFGNLRKPMAESGFVANYIDAAFNDCLFMWDSAFILLFARYGRRVFNFQRTLDNLYARQHPDGFICREIQECDGQDRFQRFDPASTGPNIMPWTEWEYYCTSGDKERLANVFPVLTAYHRWLRAYRTWPDGTYWASGWACGMDNQPRMPGNLSQEFYHGHLVWIDTCLQQILSARLILKMAEILGRRDEIVDFQNEMECLSCYINEHLWDDKSAFYYDRYPDGRLSDVKTIGAYWALISEIVPKDRLEEFIWHLQNPEEFNRHHRVPTLSADHPEYKKEGGYWLGSVWAPTNYMVLKGLNQVGYHDLTHEIALNHLDNVVKVFEQTGTIWENYAPESFSPGKPAGKNFVGWSGLPPIAVLFEYIFGLQPDVQNSRLIWDVRLLDEHGVSQYPFGNTGLINLRCAARLSVKERPVIKANSNIPLEIEIRWEGGIESIYL